MPALDGRDTIPPAGWSKRTCSTYGGARLMAGRLTLDQLAIILGIGATAARHALDVEIGVRIPDPQPHIKAINAKAMIPKMIHAPLSRIR